MKNTDAFIEEDDISDRATPNALWQLIEVAQASADVILSIDEDERISFVNTAVEQMFGYSAQELTGQPLSVLIPPTYRSGHSRHMENFNAGTQQARMMAQRQQVYGMCKDGRMVPLEISILRHKRAGPFRFSAIVRDISERLSLKNQITEHDRRYLAMLESRRRPTALLTPTGRIIDLNHLALNAHDGDNKDIVGLNIWDAPWWVGEERRNILRDLIDGIEIGINQSFVMEVRAKDGKIHKVEMSLKAMSPDGETLDFIVVEWEGQKKIENSGSGSQKSKMRLDMLQRAARIGNLEWALSSDELYWSEETYRIFGYPQGDDKPTYDMILTRVHPDDREDVHKIIQNAINGRDGFSIFYRLILPDAQEKLIHHSGSLLRSNDGKPLQILSTIQDITETSLREKELMDALEQLKETGLAKARFLANLSHELRTPLNIIIGFSEFIHNSHDSLTPDRIDEYSRYISESGHRLLLLVNDIILALRLDARMVMVQDAEVLLNKILIAATAKQTEAAEQKSMSIAFDVDEKIIVTGDEPLLSRALSAVVNNAIKFGHPGGLVSISAAQEKDSLTIAVEDNGTAVRDEQLTDMHEPFGQIDDNLNRRHEGAGLGLTIVRGVFKLHGGDVNIRRSSLGGVRVELTFPNKRVAYPKN